MELYSILFEQLDCQIDDLIVTVDNAWTEQITPRIHQSLKPYGIFIDLFQAFDIVIFDILWKERTGLKSRKKT